MASGAMELEICAAIFVVSAVVVLLVSVLGTRQKSYEEALEEARRRSHEEESALHQAKAAHKKEAGKKTKGRWSRAKVKDAGAETWPTPTGNASPPSTPTEHVEFREEAEVVLIPPEEECEVVAPPVVAVATAALRQRQPAKPILVHKAKAPTPVGDVPPEAPSAPSPVRKNSFKDTLPKDEVELKHQQQQQLQQQQQQHQQVQEGPSGEGPVRPVTPPAAPKGSPLRVDKPKRKARSEETQGEVVPSTKGEVSAAELLALVRGSPRLSEEEELVQQLVEELLNRAQPQQWHKSGPDPEAHLRKMLAERDKDLEAQKQHALSHATKVKELRQELNLQISKVQQQERTLQAKQALLAEQSSQVTRLRDESRELQQKAQKLEAELKEVRSAECAQRAEEERAQAEALSAARAEGAQALAQAQAQVTALEVQCQDLQQRLDQEAQAQTQARQASEGKVKELCKVHQAELEAERADHQRRMGALEQRWQDQGRTLEELRARLAEAQAAHSRELGDLARKQAEGDQQREEALKALEEERHRELEQLRVELDAQRAKNNDLRTKNWEVVEAMQAAERKAQAQQQQQAQEKEAHAKELQELKSALALEFEQKERGLLQRLLPKVKVDSGLSRDEWVACFEREAKELVAKVAVAHNGEAPQKDLMDEKVQLQKEVGHYQRVLSDTEKILQNLQRSVEQEERRWRDREAEHQREKSSWQEQLHESARKQEALTLRCGALEEDLLRLQGLQETTSEMQAKLKELKEKLQDEEGEKKLLEQKYDEARRSAQDVRTQLEIRLTQLEEEKKEEVALLMKELEGLRARCDTPNEEGAPQPPLGSSTNGPSESPEKEKDEKGSSSKK